MGTKAKPQQIRYDDAVLFLGKTAMLRVQNVGLTTSLDREEVKQIGFKDPIDYDADIGASMTFDTNSWGAIDGMAQLLARQPADTPVVNQCDAQGGTVGIADDPANFITMKSFKESRNRRVDVVMPVREGAYFERSWFIPGQRVTGFDFSYPVDGLATENFTTEVEEGPVRMFMGEYKDTRSERGVFLSGHACQFEDAGVDLDNEGLGLDQLVMGVSVNGEHFWRGGHYTFAVEAAYTVIVQKDGVNADVFSSGDRIQIIYCMLQSGADTGKRSTWADVLEASHPTADSDLDVDTPGLGKIKRGQVEAYFYNRHTPTFDDFADSDITAVSGTPTTVFNGNTNLSAVDTTYVDQQILFITGPNAGVYRLVSTYVGATRTITLTTALPNTPTVGDEFVLSSNAVSPHLGVRCQEVTPAADLTGEDLNELGETLPFATEIEDAVTVGVTFFESDLESYSELSGRPSSQWTDYKDDTKNLFQVPGTEETGTVDDVTPSASEFNGDDALSASDDHYNGMALRFTDGVNDGISRIIKDYVGASQLITLETPFPAAPANTDPFTILVDVLRAGTLSPDDFFRVVAGKGLDSFVVVWVYADKQKTTPLKKITLPKGKFTGNEPISLSIDGRNAIRYEFTFDDIFVTSEVDVSGTINSPFV